MLLVNRILKFYCRVTEILEDSRSCSVKICGVESIIIRGDHVGHGQAFMELEYSFLADAIEVVAPSGRFFVFNGGVEAVSCPGFPALLPSLAYIGKIRIPPAERDIAHNAQLSCLRPNGEPLVPLMANNFDARTLTVPRDRPAHHLLVVNYRQIQLYEYGEHRFVLTCDGEELGSVSFFVDPMPDVQVPHVAPGAEHA